MYIYIDKRDFKTNPQQWNIAIDFLEEHPVLIKPNFMSADGDNKKTALLWGELAERLNSVGFGERSVEKWKAVWYTKT